MAETKKNSKSAFDSSLPFERRIIELEAQLQKAQSDGERRMLEAEIEREQETVFSNLTPWQRIQLARHPLRPRMLDYVPRVFEDFVELHGDRAIGDDLAVVAGLGRFQSETVVVVGQQKGCTTDEKVRRSFGMPHPHGYRKALRMFHMAERLHLPILNFVDTPAAHPGVDAERYGQGPIIAQNLRECAGLNTPIFVVVLGEGGSGGALAIAFGDWVTMFEHAIYVVCPPESCAEILWRDKEKKELAAAAMKITAKDLLNLGAVDAILPEPGGGAHRHPDRAAAVLSDEIQRFMEGCKQGAWTPERRQKRFRQLGMWTVAPTGPASAPPLRRAANASTDGDGANREND